MEETLDKKLLLKLKKSKYKAYKIFFKVVNSLLINDTVFEPENVNRTDYDCMFLSCHVRVPE